MNLQRIVRRHYATSLETSKKALRDTTPIPKLPLSAGWAIWWRSLKKSNLQILQNNLIQLMVPKSNKENQNFTIENKKVKIDEEGNYLNEVCFSIGTNRPGPAKEVAILHGYGASLGCFARNFQLINKFSDYEHPVKIHFLDNLSFGLSSNPKIKSSRISHWKIPQTPKMILNDPDQPTDPKKLYNKYYKLIDSFEMDAEEFSKYKDKFQPIMKDLENYYLSAIDLWRKASNINALDLLVGHSYGGYWSGSYAVRYPRCVKQLVLLSPVGVERHANAVTKPLTASKGLQTIKPSLDPTSYTFLSRLPILSKQTIWKWYYLQPFLPRLLKWMGPWGVQKYYDMWYMKLFKINKLIEKHGGPEKMLKNENDVVYGTNQEIHTIIEYLYNSITNGTYSDIYVKNLLTPSTNSKYPLYDKLMEFYSTSDSANGPSAVHFLYGQYDFMNKEAGEKLVKAINASQENTAHFHSVSEGGHNLYIDNPFEVNDLIHNILVAKR